MILDWFNGKVYFMAILTAVVYGCEGRISNVEGKLFSP
jgi:hypothetical protein